MSAPTRRTTDRPLQQRALRTRDNLLRAAATTFERVGYSAATLEDIVSAAGATKGALYFHFRSKADLANAVMTAYQGTTDALAEPADAGAESVLTQIGKQFAELAELYRNDPIARAGLRLSNEHELIDPELTTDFESWTRQIARQLRAGQRDGSVAGGVNCPAAARVLVASFYGVQEVSAHLTERRDVRRRVDEWWTAMLPYLAA